MEGEEARERDRGPAKGIGDGDGKLWIVERRPLDSELSGEPPPERDMRDTIGFSLGDSAYIRN